MYVVAEFNINILNGTEITTPEIGRLKFQCLFVTFPKIDMLGSF